VQAVLWVVFDRYEARIAKLEADILHLGHGLAGVKRLLQIRGVNVLTAIGVLVEIGDIGLFDTSKQLIAYAGLAPSIRQSSGTRRQGKITKQGRKRLRTMVVHAVLALIRQPQTPHRMISFSNWFPLKLIIPPLYHLTLSGAA
jgi:transposase